MLEFVEETGKRAQIRIVGIGGAGGNAVNTMIAAGLMGADFIAANTDAQALRVNLAQSKVQLGNSLTKGLGAGANPEVGKRSTLESEDELREHLIGAHALRQERRRRWRRPGTGGRHRTRPERGRRWGSQRCGPWDQ